MCARANSAGSGLRGSGLHTEGPGTRPAGLDVRRDGGVPSSPENRWMAWKCWREPSFLHVVHVAGRCREVFGETLGLESQDEPIRNMNERVPI